MPHLRFQWLAISVALGTLALAGACGHPNMGTGGGGATGAGAGSGSGNSGGSSAGAGGGAGTGVVILPDDGADGGTVMKAACADDPNQQHAIGALYTPGYSVSAAAMSQANAVMQSMSVTEKAEQIRGIPAGNINDIFRTSDNTAKGVKGFQFSDGPRGVNLDAVKPQGGQGYSTVFPVASARGATFDYDLEYRIGAAMGDELIAAGRTMLLAPTVNILRHPAWGRSEETYGEDSFLLGRLGSAFVAGVQTYAPACAKHYAANNIERNRDSDVAQMDEQTLQEVYARHFGMIIRDGGVSCVMAAYNLIQAPPTATAIKSTQNAHLLNDILRTEFGFQGFVLSDWWAMPGGQTPAASDEPTNAAQALLAGMDMELPWQLNFSQLTNIVGSRIQESDINKAALRVLTEKYRFNVAAMSNFGLKRPTSAVNGSFSITGNDDHIALAREAALKGTVLLQNTNNVLPIKNDGTIHSVAVVSQQVPWTLQGVGSSGTVNFATDARIGDLGSSRVNVDPAKAIGPFAGIQMAAPSGITVTQSSYPQAGSNTATLAAVRAADFIVVVAGLTPEDEGEEYTIKPEDSDRDASLALDGKHGGTSQNTFIQNVVTAAAGKPVVVVLEGGSVIDVSSWKSMVQGIIMAWYPGQAGGAALGQLLFGTANFSGKLPITWPNSIADEPQFSGGNVTSMSYYLGYRWFDTQPKTPAFAFGSGLSYTTFEYSNLQVPCTTVTKGGVVNVTVDIKNTGTKDGDEVAFLFVSWPSSTVATRMNAKYKELKGFQRATIPAGKTARVSIPLRVSDLDYYDTTSKTWKIESGTVNVMVGPSADKLTLMDSFTVQ